MDYSIETKKLYCTLLNAGGAVALCCIAPVSG